LQFYVDSTLFIEDVLFIVLFRQCLFCLMW